MCHDSKNSSLWFVLLFLFFFSESQAAQNDWAEGSTGKNDGATRDFFNRGASLRWKNFLGDWYDAKGKAQGNQAYATAVIIDNDKVKPVTWNVTQLVQAWNKGSRTNHGFFLRLLKGGGPLVFASREDASKSLHPKLILETSDGPKELGAIADTYTDKSTFTSLGNKTILRVGRSWNTLIRFSLAGLKASTTIRKATLQITTTKQYGGTNTVGVFRCQQGEPIPTAPPLAGISAQFKDDVGIDKHSSVLFAERFESANWKPNWTSVSGDYGTTLMDSARKFVPFFGKALWTKIGKGKLSALSAIYGFKKKLGAEPEAIFFRYYLRLGSDWNQTIQGGKMPGIAGTYDKAGWGGRRSNGSNGWSARGAFAHTIPKGGNPFGGYTPIGSYVYHADQPTQYGEVWIWSKGYGGFIPNNQWVCVEQYVKLNTVGKKDGILRGWIDGRLAFEKKDIRYRTVGKLKIQRIWMNVYHGGKTASPYDQHMFIDNVVVAREYIGPVSSQLRKPPIPDGTVSSERPNIPDEPIQDSARPSPEHSGSSEPNKPKIDGGSRADQTGSRETQNPTDTQNPTETQNPTDTLGTADTLNPTDTRNSTDAPSSSDSRNAESGTDSQAASGCGCSSTSSSGSFLTLSLMMFMIAGIRRQKHKS